VSSADPGGVRKGAYAPAMDERTIVQTETDTHTDTETEATVAGPAAAGPEFRVFLRLADGERIEAAEFTESQQAHGFAGELMAAASPGAVRWPRVGDRYLRPETIVSIDVEESNQPRWTGSTGRATTWGGGSSAP